MTRFFLLFAMLFVSTSVSAQLDFSEEHRLSHPLLDSMHQLLENGDFQQITSLLIAQNGKLVFEEYYNGNSENSQHNTRSATKTLATLLTGIAIDQGHIESVDDPILKYLVPRQPIQNQDPRKTEITIEDLLTMSSCLECDDWNNFSRGNEERMYLIEDWTQFLLDLPVRSYMFGSKPSETETGRVFSYCTAGAAGMAELVQSATGQPITEYIISNLLEPLGIIDYKMDLTPQGLLNTAGGSEYRSRDFLRIMQMCLNKGSWNGRQIVSESWLNQATSLQVNAFSGMNYGYLFWLKPFGPTAQQYASFSMGGSGGNKVVAIPDLNLSIVITTTNYRVNNAHGITDDLLNKYIVPVFIEN